MRGVHAMVHFDPKNPLGFFIALHRDFGAILRRTQDAPAPIGHLPIGHLMERVFAQFEADVARQCAGEAVLACRGGCAACCALRVTATAPEILVVAVYLKDAAAAMPSFGRILEQRIAAAAEIATGLDEAGYMALARPCPFVVDGHCVIYELRPLACRGHASFDETACLNAMAGSSDGVPISEPHRLLRGYVQNAMQSALRDAGLAFAIYEFAPALAIALREEAAEAWSKGEDPFAACRAGDVSLAEMAATFDAIKSMAP